MKTVRVSMDENVHSDLVKRARKAGLHSVALYMLQKASGRPSDSSRAANLTRKALRSLKKVRVGEVFQVKDLLPGVWDSQTTGVKLRIGKQFYEEVISGRYNIQAANKNSSNHQLYKRTG